MELIRYTLLGKEDLALGIGTFDVRLADGRVVTLSKVDIGALLNDTEKSTQVVSISTLTLRGGQLTFPATAAPSSDANTLDDYEEGTWTPSLGGTTTYAQQIGSYTKIGRTVFIDCTVEVTLIGTGSSVAISGLPFSVAARSPLAVGEASGLALSLVSVTAYASTSSTSIILNGRTAAAASENAGTILGNGSRIDLAGFYRI